MIEIMVFLSVWLALFVLDDMGGENFLDHIVDHDECTVCRGMRGGVPGNENIVDGVVMCDYCHASKLAGQVYS